MLMMTNLTFVAGRVIVREYLLNTAKLYLDAVERLMIVRLIVRFGRNGSCMYAVLMIVHVRYWWCMSRMMHICIYVQHMICTRHYAQHAHHGHMHTHTPHASHIYIYIYINLKNWQHLAQTRKAKAKTQTPTQSTEATEATGSDGKWTGSSLFQPTSLLLHPPSASGPCPPAPRPIDYTSTMGFLIAMGVRAGPSYYIRSCDRWDVWWQWDF